MIIQTLNNLWQQKKRSLGKRLQKGISDLADVLRPVSENNNYTQETKGNEIHWCTRDGRTEIVFFYVFDPRDYEIVSNVFRRAQDTHCECACLFVHQWADGEGNWDVFGLHPQRGLVHWNRFWGARTPAGGAGPFLRDDIFNLFACGRKCPFVSRRMWARLLTESVHKTQDQLSLLAGEHACFQDRIGEVVRWRNADGQTEALFSIHQNFPGLDEYIKLYDHIKIDRCPVTFVFQKAHPEVFDIFRFSTRSYIEHHNQLK